MSFSEHTLAELRDLAEMTATAAAAVQVGLFSELARGGRTPKDLAAKLNLNPRAVRIVLPVLVELGLATEEPDGRFGLTDRGMRELGDPESPDYQGRGLPLWLENLRGWTRIPEALESGEPVLGDGKQEIGRDGLARYMAGMAATPRERALRVVDACLERAEGAMTALDIGGGPGVYARAFLERGMKVTLLDRPETIAFVSEEYGLGGVDGLTLIGGDFTQDSLPAGPYDMVLLSNVVHIYSPEENRRILERVSRVTKPGSVLGVADFIRGESTRAARFALVMLLRTTGGNTYGRDEVEEWMKGAGFRDPELHQVDEDRHMITARRSRQQ